MNVIKRDGRPEPFEYSKIETKIEDATSGIPGSIELQETINKNFRLLLRDNIPTTEVQEQLINTARKLVTPQNPIMGLVAGRLLMMDIIGNVEKERGFEVGKLVELWMYNLDFGLYNPELHSTELLDVLHHLEEHIDLLADYSWNYASTVSWKLRYLSKHETPQEVFAIISAIIAVSESTITIEAKKDLAVTYYKTLSAREISLATPFLLNLRMKNGNLSSCFVMDIPDDLSGQYDKLKDIAAISKNGGGVGAFIGNIRAKGSRIGKVKGAADSIVPFSQVVNSTINYVNQMGKRKGACTLALPIWHADILEYLNLQTEVGDIRRKAHDIFLQVTADSVWINALKDDISIPLVCPLEVQDVLGVDLNANYEEYNKYSERLINMLESGDLQIGQVIRARELYKLIATAQMIKGTPYITFIDNWNKLNPLKDVAPINASNLCVESTSAFNEDMTHTCNLISLVLPNISNDNTQHVVAVATRMLDSIVDISTVPTISAQAHNNSLRVLGIGAMGLHDWLADRKLSYTDVIEIGKLFEDIAYYAAEYSCTLAEEKGSFPLYDKSTWADGKIYSRSVEWYKDKSYDPHRWELLGSRIKASGIRNAQLLAIAPNTSSGVLQGVTPSILPVFNKWYTETNSLGALQVYPKYLQERWWYYKEYQHHSIPHMNTVVAEIQKWVDAGISYEWAIQLNDTDIGKLASYVIDAHEKGIKSLYYLRFLRDDSSIGESDVCVSCAN